MFGHFESFKKTRAHSIHIFKHKKQFDEDRRQIIESQKKILSDYINHGANYLSDESQHKRKCLVEQKILENKRIRNRCKNCRIPLINIPWFQVLFDCLIALLIYIFQKQPSEKALEWQKQLHDFVRGLFEFQPIELIYIKPIVCFVVFNIIIGQCKLSIFKILNRSFYSISMFYIRVIYDILCFFVLCKNLLNTSDLSTKDGLKQQNTNSPSSKQLLPQLMFIVPLELIVYLISIKSAQKRQRKVQFRLLREEITNQEINDLMWSSSGDDTFTPDQLFGGPYQMDLYEKSYKPIVVVMTDFVLGFTLMAILIFKFQNMAYYHQQEELFLLCDQAMNHLPFSFVMVPLYIFLILIFIDFSFFAISNKCQKNKVNQYDQKILEEQEISQFQVNRQKVQANQSGNTANLFWVRIIFFFASFFLLHLRVLIYVDQVKPNEETDKSQKQSQLNSFWPFDIFQDQKKIVHQKIKAECESEYLKFDEFVSKEQTKMLIQIYLLISIFQALVYYFVVKPAKIRHIYQEGIELLVKKYVREIKEINDDYNQKKKKGKVNQKKYERAKDLAIKFWPIKQKSDNKQSNEKSEVKGTNLIINRFDLDQNFQNLEKKVGRNGNISYNKDSLSEVDRYKYF